MARILKNWLGWCFAVGLVTACMVTLEVPETGHFLDNPVPVQAETEGQTKINPDRQVEADVVPAVQQSDPALPAGALLLLRGPKIDMLHLIDPDTGRDWSGYEPLPLDFAMTGSAQGANGYLGAITAPRTMACGFGGCQTMGYDLHLIDLVTWTDRMIELAGPVHVLAGITNRLVFSPDEQRLAVTYAAAVPGKDQTQGEYSLAQIDLDRQVIDQVVKLTGMPRFVGYSADGRSLIVYAVSYHRENGTAQPGTPQVSRYRAADLSLEWQVDLPGVRDGQFWTDTGHAPAAEYWQPALVFAAEANRLYIVHADTDQLTTVDPVAQSVETVEIKASQTWLDRVLARTATVAYAKVLLGVTREAVLSPVEDRLYIISSVYEESGWSIPAGMQILNPATGQILTDYETEATDLVLDQGRLYLYRQTEAGYWTEILDADNLEAIMSRRDQLIRPARLLNGDPTLLSDTYNAGTTSLTIFDPVSLAAWRSWVVDGYNRWLISL